MQTAPPNILFLPYDATDVRERDGTICAVATGAGLDAYAQDLSELTRHMLQAIADDDAFKARKDGEVETMGWPAGLRSRRLLLAKCEARGAARKAGAALATAAEDGQPILALVHDTHDAVDLAFGYVLRNYAFERHRTTPQPRPGALTIMCADQPLAEELWADRAAVASGVYLARDLTNEPANALSPPGFAARLKSLRNWDVEVEVLEPPELRELGMNALLGVAQGSATPPRVAVMTWKGAGDAAPVAFLGKGVVFDTGGISIKPAQGMEEMTGDKGGAAVVCGLIRTLARRKAKVNAVGIVGLVENMPDGAAQRPGDVVTSMKGDTIEVINTDAEGRLVLADLLTYVRRFEPQAVVDLATLTGAVIVALGNDRAGLFAPEAEFANRFLRAGQDEGEGIWRLPVDEEHADALKSRIADVANVGGSRAGGACVAAAFLRRFAPEGVPWAHLDIAGVAWRKEATTFAPKGATGWGVRLLDRLVRDNFET